MHAKTFNFVDFKYNVEESTAYFYYSVDDKYHFTETIKFNNKKQNLDIFKAEALNKCLFHLHIICGISYYKAFLPDNIIIETGELSYEETEFYNSFYVNGLAEFAHINGITLRDKIKFPVTESASPNPSDMLLFPRTVVPVGGGKDSIVSIETIRPHEDITLFYMGNSATIKNVIEVTGLPHINVIRTIDKKLIELNESGTVLNGHVPITGILSSITVASSVLCEFDTVIMSNEQSANEGNITKDGFEINHQFSKSLKFEKQFQQFIHNCVLTDFKYFSVLRPLSELAITKIFSTLPEYHSVFVSCNHVFKIDETKRLNRWCGNCPKCRFVFLALATFLPPKKVIKIFNKNLLNDPLQEQGYKELLGLDGHKPFECVGEIQESLVAFHHCISTWQNNYIINKLSDQVTKSVTTLDLTLEDYTITDTNPLPAPYNKYLNEIITTCK
jgi:hypothetical protein